MPSDATGTVDFSPSLPEALDRVRSLLHGSTRKVILPVVGSRLSQGRGAVVEAANPQTATADGDADGFL